METIRAILALVPIEGLKIQQMDIKGAWDPKGEGVYAATQRI
jgi:hypothetical protein